MAHHYVRHLDRYRRAVLNLMILARAPFAAKRLLKMRTELVEWIDAERARVRDELGFNVY